MFPFMYNTYFFPKKKNKITSCMFYALTRAKNHYFAKICFFIITLSSMHNPFICRRRRFPRNIKAISISTLCMVSHRERVYQMCDKCVYKISF